MTAVPSPPSYPRVAHLVTGRGTSDDGVLGPDELAKLLSSPVVIEEKLDGANVMLWLDERTQQVTSSLRSGPGASDRAGQLGPLKAWVAARGHVLAQGLTAGRVLYGEWLLLTHTVPYDRLPSYLVVLDVLDERGDFLHVDDRDRWAAALGLVSPPGLFRGTVRSVPAAERLIGVSSFGIERAEGVVLRGLGRERHIAKLVRADFRPLPDEAWAKGRPKNKVVAVEAEAWR